VLVSLTPVPSPRYNLTISTEAQSAPEIFYAVPNSSATYMVVALDLDAPFPSFGALGPILHWIQPGFKASPNNTLTSNEPFVANYIGPGRLIPILKCCFPLWKLQSLGAVSGAMPETALKLLGSHQKVYFLIC
jgi:hypothetical protein